MKFGLRRWVLTAAVAAGGVSSFALLPTHRVKAADPQSPVAIGQTPGQPTGQAAGQEVVAVEKLKTDAFHELRTGHFDKTNELLRKAASVSHDPQVERMAEWANGFETQREEFAAERHKQYDKAVEDVKKLQEKDKTDYAIDAAARAYLLADDKKAFRDRVVGGHPGQGRRSAGPSSTRRTSSGLRPCGSTPTSAPSSPPSRCGRTDSS